MGAGAHFLIEINNVNCLLEPEAPALMGLCGTKVDVVTKPTCSVCLCVFIKERPGNSEHHRRDVQRLFWERVEERQPS